MASFMQNASKFKWYHWVGGITTGVASNALIMVGMGKTYRWYYADSAKSAWDFRARHGMPSETQRLEVFSWLAPMWDDTIGNVERGSAAERCRGEHMRTARGDVLEVAVGTGRCFEALESGGEVRSYAGVDIVEAMLEVARPKLGALPFPARVLRADAHRLPFPDASFDTVVGSLCLASLERPAVALEEMARVCRPDGEVLLVETGVASNWFVRLCQQYLGLVPDPKHAWEMGSFDDCDPAALVRACPRLVATQLESKGLGNWYVIRASPV